MVMTQQINSFALILNDNCKTHLPDLLVNNFTQISLQARKTTAVRTALIYSEL